MRCESDDAIEIGRAHGISLFQGYFLDHLLAEKITREEAAERLGAALARHRRTAATPQHAAGRSEEHTSELQSLMRISYAVFCLKKKKKIPTYKKTNTNTKLSQLIT